MKRQHNHPVLRQQRAVQRALILIAVAVGVTLSTFIAFLLQNR